MKPFNSFIDLTGKNRVLKCSYHGKTKYILLEGRIFSETKDQLEVGVSLLEQQVYTHKYDSSRKSLNIWYEPFHGTVAGLHFKKFDVPNYIQEINVYDKGQEIK